MYIQSRQLQSPFPSLWHIQPSPLGRIFRGWFSAASLCFHLDCLYVGFLVDGSFAWSGNLEKFLRGSTVFLILFFFCLLFCDGGLLWNSPFVFPAFTARILPNFRFAVLLEGNEPRRQRKGEVKLWLRGVLSCPVLSVCLSVRAFIAFVSVSTQRIKVRG